MTSFNFRPPLCLSCGIALEHKIETHRSNGSVYQVDYCPNCGEIFNRAEL